MIVKELLANWRDPKNRAVLLISPLFQLLIFAFAATQEVKNVPIAIFDQDRSQISREFITRIARMIDSRRTPFVL